MINDKSYFRQHLTVISEKPKDTTNYIFYIFVKLRIIILLASHFTIFFGVILIEILDQMHSMVKSWILDYQ